MVPTLATVGICFLGMILAAEAQRGSLAESILQFVLVEGRDTARNEPRNQRQVHKEYDFVVIGAGSAGCVVANRLSEIKDWSVLLIEAGGEEHFLMDVPLLANYLQFSNANWKYKTQPSDKYCLGMENRQCHWPRGKVMGGSSVLNYMIYTRGNKRDYDRWEEMGNKGWGWESVLPYFKKLEDMTNPNFAMEKEFQSEKGYMSVTDVPFRTPIGEAFVESGLRMGYPLLDYNKPYHYGFNHLIVSMKNGTRYSSSRAFLHSIRTRPNLYVKKKSLVTKIIIDPATKTAKGVEFVSDGRAYTVKARKEVILSGGSINSPQLLMLSGIGPKRHLAKRSVRVIQDLKVGYNLHDHYLPGGLTYVIDKPYSIKASRIMQDRKVLLDYLGSHHGPLSSPGGCESVAFMNMDNTTMEQGPDMEILLIDGGIPSDRTLHVGFNINESLYKEYYEPMSGADTVMTFPILLSPKSRGRILLKDNNSFHYPLIYPNYFSDPQGYDMKIIIAGIRKSNEIMSMGPFRKFGTRLISAPLPPCRHHKFDSDQYWNCYARHMTFTIYHPVGTCKMGPESDRGAVVDDRLRVRGIKRLRVIDASIMPVITRAHTNAPTYMIAEKGSDMIKQDWGIDIDFPYMTAGGEVFEQTADRQRALKETNQTYGPGTLFPDPRPNSNFTDSPVSKNKNKWPLPRKHAIIE